MVLRREERMRSNSNLMVGIQTQISHPRAKIKFYIICKARDEAKNFEF